MKKIIFSLFIALILANCDIKPRESKADDFQEYLKTYKLAERRYNDILYTVFPKDSIVYHIYTLGDGSQDAGIFVVNHTKELLEVELLKKQLNK